MTVIQDVPYTGQVGEGYFLLGLGRRPVVVPLIDEPMLPEYDLKRRITSSLFPREIIRDLDVRSTDSGLEIVGNTEFHGVVLRVQQVVELFQRERNHTVINNVVLR